LAKYASFFYGVVLLIVVLAMPGGVNEMLRGISERLRRSSDVKTNIEPDLDKLRTAIQQAHL
jgi:hypothetical protein